MHQNKNYFEVFLTMYYVFSINPVLMYTCYGTVMYVNLWQFCTYYVDLLDSGPDEPKYVRDRLKVIC